MRLLSGGNSLITVLEGDGSEWTALGGRGFEALACGRDYETFGDFCTPVEATDMDQAAIGYQAVPFGMLVRQKFGVMCTRQDAIDALSSVLNDSAEHQVGEVLWNGVQDVDWNGTVYLTASDVSRSDRSADPRTDVAQILKDARDVHPEIKPLLHLGLGTALQIGQDIDVLDVPYVVNSGYPIDGIAVTGPIVIRLGSVQDLQTYDQSVNRVYAEATRLAAVEFDPCLARLGATTS